MSRVAIHTVIVLAVLVGLYALWLLRAAAILFVLSLVIAAALRPLIARLGRMGLPHMLALSAAYLFTFAALATLLATAAGPLVAQAQRFGDEFVLAYQTMYGRLHETDSAGGSALGMMPPPDDLFVALAGERGAELLQMVLGATFSLFALVVDMVIVVFLGVYWSIDQIHFERLWLSLLPVDRRRTARDVWRSIETELGAYARSEAVQTIAAGILLWLGYWRMGQPYPVLLAVVGAMAWLVPWVGVLLAAAALVFFSAPELVLDARSALGSLVPSLAYTSVVLLLLQLFVEPRLFDRRRYNALITAIIIFGMAEIAGLTGLLLGAPLATALQIAGGHWMRWRIALAAEPAANGSFTERLAALHAALSRQRRPAPELTSLVERLTTLVQGAEDLLDRPAPSPPAD